MYRLFTIVVVLAFFVLGLAQISLAAEMFRVRGGIDADFKDKAGNVWFAGQKEYKKDTLGGWVGTKPQTAAGGKVVNNKTGYDDALFLSVSWQANPGTVKWDVNTGKGTFKVVYLVGEHWSPKNRGFDIIIEGKTAKEAYVTPGQDEVDLLTFEGVTVSDEVMSFEFKGNPKTAKGDLNPMFSALEITQLSAVAVEPKSKLTTTWGDIKKR